MTWPTKSYGEEEWPATDEEGRPAAGEDYGRAVPVPGSSLIGTPCPLALHSRPPLQKQSSPQQARRAWACGSRLALEARCKGVMSSSIKTQFSPQQGVQIFGPLSAACSSTVASNRMSTGRGRCADLRRIPSLIVHGARRDLTAFRCFSSPLPRI
jgi:hypothetical protein